MTRYFSQLENIKNKRVLIAALDWGMGHTTRCVALIKTLLSNNNQVVFAGNARQLGFIRKDLPQISTVLLDGYDISLDSEKNTYAQLAKQLPKVWKAIKDEEKWLADYCDKNGVDCIIADNRYGFRHDEIHSIVLTHQLTLQIPRFKKRANRTLKNYLEMFDECWVPDYADNKLTGELSKADIAVPVHFIGPLNRFQLVMSEVNYDYLVILSGPEPERSRFLNEVVAWKNTRKAKMALVGAQIEGFFCIENPTTTELQELIAASETVVSRAGYTTIMEMVELEKKAILVPTKGQYEQMYLAQHIVHDKIKFVETLSAS